MLGRGVLIVLISLTTLHFLATADSARSLDQTPAEQVSETLHELLASAVRRKGARGRLIRQACAVLQRSRHTSCSALRRKNRKLVRANADLRRRLALLSADSTTTMKEVGHGPNLSSLVSASGQHPPHLSKMPPRAAAATRGANLGQHAGSAVPAQPSHPDVPSSIHGKLGPHGGVELVDVSRAVHTGVELQLLPAPGALAAEATLCTPSPSACASHAALPIELGAKDLFKGRWVRACVAGSV
jgi:hypothetical protein